jgi:hypothetical protein
VALTALVLSIPSAATAVLDLADRITKRRTAKELIDHAKQLACRQVTVRVISRSRTIELRAMTPTSSWTSCQTKSPRKQPQPQRHRRPETYDRSSRIFQASYPILEMSYPKYRDWDSARPPSGRGVP